MIKVYSGKKIIYLTNNLDFEEKGLYSALFSDRTSKEYLRQFIENIKNKGVKKIYIQSENLKKLLTTFKTRFRVIEAAGGLVRNTKGEYLFILRNGKWDLPKGKREKGETIKQCALREVKEECGIKGLKIIKELNTTYHTYFLEEKEVLKPTYWFEMQCPEISKLTPQTEEGITKVKWFKKENLKTVLKNTYPSIIDVISEIS